MSTLIRYHHDGETPEFIAAVNEDLALLAANHRPQPVDWHPVGHRAAAIIVLFALLTGIGLVLLSVRSAVYGDVHVHVPSSGAQR